LFYRLQRALTADPADAIVRPEEDVGMRGLA
jgi:hypothetical protein